MKFGTKLSSMTFGWYKSIGAVAVQWLWGDNGAGNWGDNGSGNWGDNG